MGKRGYGEGTVSQRPNGTWWGRVTVGTDENGKQIRKAFYGSTRKEVQDKLTTAINQVNQGTYIEPSDMPLGQWLDKWLDEHKRVSIRPSTYDKYTDEVRRFIKPTLGSYPLKALRPDTIQRFISDMAKSGQHRQYVLRNTAWYLKASLEQAAKNGLISKNPAQYMVVPVVGDLGSSKSLTKEEQDKFIAECQRDAQGSIFLLILSTGLRLGEATALTWEDINFDDLVLTVNKTSSRQHDETGKECYVVGPPKTAHSYRNVPLLPAAVNLLMQIRESQQDIWSPKGFVFLNRRGVMFREKKLQEIFKLIKNRSGLEGDYTPHTLRHTFATRGLESGVPLKVMQELLGHSRIEITANLYTHVLPCTKEAEMMKLADTIIL